MNITLNGKSEPFAAVHAIYRFIFDALTLIWDLPFRFYRNTPEAKRAAAETPDSRAESLTAGVNTD